MSIFECDMRHVTYFVIQSNILLIYINWTIATATDQIEQEVL